MWSLLRLGIGQVLMVSKASCQRIYGHWVSRLLPPCSSAFHRIHAQISETNYYYRYLFDTTLPHANPATFFSSPMLGDSIYIIASQASVQYIAMTFYKEYISLSKIWPNYPSALPSPPQSYLHLWWQMADQSHFCLDRGKSGLHRISRISWLWNNVVIHHNVVIVTMLKWQ